MNEIKNILSLLIALLYGFNTFSQATPVQLKEFISDKYIATADIQYTTEIKEFYAQLNYKTAWVQRENTANLEIIFNNLQSSAGLGLQEKDYQFDYIKLLRNNAGLLQNIQDSLETEVRITDAAIHF